MCSPASVKMRVMPTFCAITPERMRAFLPSQFSAPGDNRRPELPLELDLDVDACGQVEFHQCVDRLRRRVDDIEKALVSAHLELIAALLVDVRRTVHGEPLKARRQRNGSANLSAGALRRVDDLSRRGIENSMIECL